MLKKNFPKMKIETAPEYSTASGNLVQLIADEMQGQRTATTAFTEKLRAHPIIDRNFQLQAEDFTRNMGNDFLPSVPRGATYRRLVSSTGGALRGLSAA